MNEDRERREEKREGKKVIFFLWISFPFFQTMKQEKMSSSSKRGNSAVMALSHYVVSDNRCSNVSKRKWMWIVEIMPVSAGDPGFKAGSRLLYKSQNWFQSWDFDKSLHERETEDEQKEIEMLKNVLFAIWSTRTVIWGYDTWRPPSEPLSRKRKENEELKKQVKKKSSKGGIKTLRWD